MDRDNQGTGDMKRAVKSTGVIGLAVMLSRVLGLVREVMLGALFGGSKWMDCFYVAFRIPNLLRDLFAEGALSQAFVTTFSKRATEKGEASAWQLAHRVMSLATVVISALILVGMLFSQQIVDVLLMASADQQIWGQEERELTILLVRIMYPFLLMVSLSALVMGMLNSRQIFGMPALASCFFNIGSMLGGGILGWFFDPHWGKESLIGISIGVLIGGMGQLCVQFPALWKAGFRFRWDTQWHDEGVKKVLQLMGPAVIAASAVQVNVMVNSAFALKAGPGAVSWLNWSFRLMQLPLGMFGVAVATVTLPALAKSCVAGVGDQFAPILNRGINLVTVLVLPSAMGLLVFADEIISMIFQHGKFSVHDVAETAVALRCYAYGLLFYSWLKIIQPAFYALDKRWLPMMVSFLAMALNAGLNWLFVVHWHFGHRSLALTTSAIACVNFLLLYGSLCRLVKTLRLRAILPTLLRCCVAVLLMAAVAEMLKHGVLGAFVTKSLFMRWLTGGLSLMAAAVTYIGACYMLRVAEIQDCLIMLTRRFKWTKRFAGERGK